MKKSGKILSALLTLCLVLALAPAPASALKNETFEYTLSGDEVYINGLVDKSIVDLVIPSTIDGKPVTVVERLRDCPNLESVVFPATVKKIGTSCLMGSSNVSSVTLPEGLETIGNYAFASCSLVSVVVPESVTQIGEGAFNRNARLTSIQLPSTLNKISRSMLATCVSLKSIELPSTVTSLEYQCFFESGLESITIPESVKYIGKNAFTDTANLTEVNFSAGLEEIGYAAFYNCPSLQSVLLPTTLTAIKSEAFGRTGIESLILPYGVTEVGDRFISGKIKEVYAPSTVARIDVSDNCLVYCMPGSNLEKYCKERKISFATDASCDTRINVLYNGKRVSFGAYGQNPEIVNDRTMVPLRSIFEAMGAKIEWDEATKTVTATRGSDKVVMTVGQEKYTVNGTSKTMDAPPVVLNDRTMVPVRVVAESFGADVTWHSASATVLINE